MAGQGWSWFFVTSGIVYGSFMVLGCAVLIVYKIHQTKVQKQKFRQEVDYYAQFVGDYHTALNTRDNNNNSINVPKQQRSLEFYSRTLWAPESATNCRDYRRNCSEALSATIGGHDQSHIASTPLTHGSMMQWSVYDEDRQQFTSINSTPFCPYEGSGEASSSRLIVATPSSAAVPSSPPSVMINDTPRTVERPRLRLSTMWPSSSWIDTPSSSTSSPMSYCQEEGITPCTATEYSPATSIASSYNSFVDERYTEEEEDCCGSSDDAAAAAEPMSRASFETVGLGAEASPLRRDFDLEAYRFDRRSGSSSDDGSEDSEQQWHESVTRMTKKMSSAVQSLFLKGKADGLSQQQLGAVAVREFLEV